MPGLEELTDELYALPPSAFVDARTAVVAAARDAGDKPAAARLAKLRKPTVSAWLANRLVRDHRDLVDGALAVGPALREATVAGDGAALRDLARHRKQLLNELLAAARDIAQDADVAFGAAVQRELESTLTAAASDPDAAAALVSGRLTAPLSFSGLGFELGAIPPERTAAPSPDPSTPRPRARRRAGEASSDEAAPEPPTPERTTADERAAAAREQAVADADQALAVARLQDADASATLAAAEAALAEATAAEKAAAAAHKAAKEALSDARADLTAAKADAATTSRAVDAALSRVEAARRR